MDFIVIDGAEGVRRQLILPWKIIWGYPLLFLGEGSGLAEGNNLRDKFSLICRRHENSVIF